MEEDADVDEDVARVLAGTGGDPDKIRENVSRGEHHTKRKWRWWQREECGRGCIAAAGISGTQGCGGRYEEDWEGVEVTEGCGRTHCEIELYAVLALG